jgi:DNA-binding transcriptional LysR family regulator
VVRLGSVKAAASELGVSEAAVSMNVTALRKELGDPLFERAGSGIAFTPGGLRLASRANEMLGLQDRTRREVADASNGKRILRVAASSLFAEYAAAGLIEVFSRRADDLEVELSVVSADRLIGELTAMAADVTIGPHVTHLPDGVEQTPFLRYELLAVCGSTHRLARGSTGVDGELWNLGPSAAEEAGVGPEMLRRIGVPEERQRIFQSHAAALTEVRAGRGLGLALGFRFTEELRSGSLRRLDGRGLSGHGIWHLSTLGANRAPAAARELTRFITTPRATQAMLNGSGAGITHFKPRVHITLWS